MHLLGVLWLALSAFNAVGGLFLLILGSALFPHLREMQGVPPDVPVGFLIRLFSMLGVIVLAKRRLADSSPDGDYCSARPGADVRTCAGVYLAIRYTVRHGARRLHAVGIAVQSVAAGIRRLGHGAGERQRPRAGGTTDVSKRDERVNDSAATPLENAAHVINAAKRPPKNRAYLIILDDTMFPHDVRGRLARTPEADEVFVREKCSSFTEIIDIPARVLSSDAIRLTHRSGVDSNLQPGAAQGARRGDPEMGNVR